MTEVCEILVHRHFRHVERWLGKDEAAAAAGEGTPMDAGSRGSPAEQGQMPDRRLASR